MKISYACKSRISELKERIADRPEYFNDGVCTYNTGLCQIPEMGVTWLLSLKPRELFEVAAVLRAVMQAGFESSNPSGRFPTHMYEAR